VKYRVHFNGRKPWVQTPAYCGNRKAAVINLTQAARMTWRHLRGVPGCVITAMAHRVHKEGKSNGRTNVIQSAPSQAIPGCRKISATLWCFLASPQHEAYTRAINVDGVPFSADRDPRLKFQNASLAAEHPASCSARRVPVLRRRALPRSVVPGHIHREPAHHRPAEPQS